VFGVGELFWAKRRFKREQGMTHQEMKEEMKEDYGDPHVRSERRSLQEALLLETLPQRVKQSRVIIAAPSERSIQ
jgi:flagellar biosynthesis protein FlhB